MNDEEKVFHEIASAKGNFFKHFGRDLSDMELLALVELAYRERRDVWRKQQFYHIKSDLLCQMEEYILGSLVPKEPTPLHVVEVPDPVIEEVKRERREQSQRKEEVTNLSILPNRKERKPKPGNSSKSP